MKIAFMYPGQGAQKNGMMQDFFEGNPEEEKRPKAAEELEEFSQGTGETE